MHEDPEDKCFASVPFGEWSGDFLENSSFNLSFCVHEGPESLFLVGKGK